MSGQAFANDATASLAHASEPRLDLDLDLNPETPSINATTWSDPPINSSSSSAPNPIDPLLFADEVEVDVDVAQHAVDDAESASDDAESYVSDLDMFPDPSDDEEDIVAPALAPAPAPASASTLAEAQALIFAAATETETVADDAADSDDADMTIYAASDRPSVDVTEDSATDADSLMTGTDNQSILTIDASSSQHDGRAPSTRTIETSDLQLAFQQRFGRTYPSRDYILPNDWVIPLAYQDSLLGASQQDECIRLAIQHHLWLRTYNSRLANSPKRERAARVLDCGTGTGHWASDFADDHPEAVVIGVDLSPIQLTAVPPNLWYEIFDLEQPWPWRELYDFIFFRHMNTAFADWVAIFEKALGHLEPGGYIELQDNSFPIMCDDDTMAPDSAIARWSTLLMEATELMGRPCDTPSRFKQLLDLAGFEAIVEEKTVWPIGPWDVDHPREKEIGIWCRENCLEALEASTMHLFTQFLHWSQEDTRDFCDEVEREIRGGSVHAYFTVYCVYGRKPYA
ncbi:methyltransferase domain-containing protein [Colletotrichum costaricense]|uniref:Methyltransferase domain-containing protein n=1 Tax=Colletotrichum costaricense TaxID=1209916 RepID=A0AAI9YWL6_9PEZI|nr:methyltransferase domain-containing protein [Colletotrichum costaricense]KAK1526053.1 methyltransferase domain-containing protein [Colletotrichum costaricense]